MVVCGKERSHSQVKLLRVEKQSNLRMAQRNYSIQNTLHPETPAQNAHEPSCAQLPQFGHGGGVLCHVSEEPNSNSAHTMGMGGQGKK